MTRAYRAAIGAKESCLDINRTQPSLEILGKKEAAAPSFFLDK
jgi:hypothetical protein